MNTSRKEREREFRKQEILSAALDLFSNNGYNNTTLDQIAETAEFGKGTIYNYFQSKEEIYREIIENIFKQYFDSLKSIAQNSTNLTEFVTELTRSLLNYCSNNKAAFLLLAQKRMGSSELTCRIESEKLKEIHQQSNEIFKEKIVKAIEEKEIRQIDPDKLIVIYRGMVFSYIHQNIHCSKIEGWNVEDETDLIISIIFNGILNK